MATQIARSPGDPAALGSREAPHCPIVALGSSAGGLEACSAFLSALPPVTGMAFVFVQHLDPTHESLMADLLAGHTPMVVRQVADGMRIEPDHVYVIPPGAYLSVTGEVLHLSEPTARRGTRVPFDFLLHSLAKAVGSRAICVILSGTGADGSVGLATIKDEGGLVLAQDPLEAGFDGMPRSAIATGQVDLVLPVAQMPDAILSFVRHAADLPRRKAGKPKKATAAWLADVIGLLRERTSHDFTLYKPGTLQRRIERRMAMAALKPDDGRGYLEMLRRDEGESERLAQDLLIHVTGFFRDPAVFSTLETEVIPKLVQDHEADRPIRVWVVGCSTGEEAYSVAMLLQEKIDAGQRGQTLQVFASDIDAGSIARAREGLFPSTIASEIPEERLNRFFDKVEHGYRVKASLRSNVIFAIQDVLSDPPFSRIDMVTCRNLLIYLGLDAQQTVLSLFHFALRPNGILLLGNAETPTPMEGRFEVISQAARIYRRIGRSRPGDIGFQRPSEGAGRRDERPSDRKGTAAQTVLGDLCERALLDSFAPAAALVDLNHQCLHFSGATSRYLKIAPGPVNHALLRLVPATYRPRLRAALQRSAKEKLRVVVPGGDTTVDGRRIGFDIDVRPVAFGAETLLLVSFFDRPGPAASTPGSAQGDDAARVIELEREMDALRIDLQDALHEIELAHEQQKIASEEALSINEEYQSTNEELLTSKEELQSLNEELTALNVQLRETLDRERITSSDLQNVLFSTDVATLFLDRSLNIRFFTPATRVLFNLIAGDIGRPISDLQIATVDGDLLQDARVVLSTLQPIEKEIAVAQGQWLQRRTLPYRNTDAAVGGVVITFVDVTERRHIEEALKAAEAKAQKATAAKTRFLAAASHDLRQPLQTLALLHGLMAKTITGEVERGLLARLDETLESMTSMLNTLLDVNQIEAGIVQASLEDFPVGDLLDRMKGEFSYHAAARGLSLHVVHSSASIRSDPKLLEQILRNLLSNALKYTRTGKILLGCRRRQGALSVEIWDTGLGIAKDDLTVIFEEYHQLDNSARERSRGLGLGLSIVQRLATILKHPISVRSQPGRGSAFAIEVSLPASGASAPASRLPDPGPAKVQREEGALVLLVEDDPVVLELLTLYLVSEGYRIESAVDGPTAMKRVTGGKLRPQLVLTDYNLPRGLSGVALAGQLRRALSPSLPVIVLSGDISTDTLRDIAQATCVHLNKPVKLSDLSSTIARLVTTSPSGVVPPHTDAVLHHGDRPTIYVVDDDPSIREALRSVLEGEDYTVGDFATSEMFLDSYVSHPDTCLIVDAYLPGLSGVALLTQLRDRGDPIPTVMITGSSDVPIAVEAMKAGAFDFIEKPVRVDELLASVARAFQVARNAERPAEWRAAAEHQLAGLTARQRQIMDLVLAGHPSKNIAADLRISQRTVENHRAAIMRKTGCKSLPALARLAIAAEGADL